MRLRSRTLLIGNLSTRSRAVLSNELRTLLCGSWSKGSSCGRFPVKRMSGFYHALSAPDGGRSSDSILRNPSEPGRKPGRTP
ncbi:hypothetical protein HMPREF9440_01634 [Sutterella parvirubra YIT 11816]|uniref:Uncharacterized protein n=1 Tax=Sutterella parvirubra YIT 11816 TaxID=762967 RepID=H3KFW4_9BURK|nr:hypothetical protein HMPREF9440_01634 [Sutterella parvirubra YIT 11816]